MNRQRDEMPPAVREALERGRKIEAIERLRESRGLDLRQAKEEVDGYLQAHPELHAVHRASGHRHGLRFWVLLSLALGLALLLFSDQL